MPGTHLLPPNLLKLFNPRPPLSYARPVDRDRDRVKSKNVGGVAGILNQLREASTEGLLTAGTADVNMEEGEEPAYTHAEEVKRMLRREARKQQRTEEFKKSLATYKPADDPEAVGDPYKTLFISRLHKAATESDLRRDFEGYGTIERVRIVRDSKGRSRGYAFIIYERERDMKAAYKESDGLHIMGKKILVDVERGRTVRGWRPRRLGGGLGGRPKPVVIEPPMMRPGTNMRGGFGDRGGGGGGFRGRGGDRPFNDRGSFGGGGRGSFSDRGNFNGGDRQFSDRGSFGGGRGSFSDRGNVNGGDRQFSDRGSFGGGRGSYPDRGGFQGGGFRGGRGGGIGFGNGGPPNGYSGPPGFNAGPPIAGPPNGYPGAPPMQGYGNSGPIKRAVGPDVSNGYDEDRDSKRRRY